MPHKGVPWQRDCGGNAMDGAHSDRKASQANQADTRRFCV